MRFFLLKSWIHNHKLFALTLLFLPFLMPCSVVWREWFDVIYFGVVYCFARRVSLAQCEIFRVFGCLPPFSFSSSQFRSLSFRFSNLLFPLQVCCFVWQWVSCVTLISQYWKLYQIVFLSELVPRSQFLFPLLIFLRNKQSWEWFLQQLWFPIALGLLWRFLHLGRLRLHLVNQRFWLLVECLWGFGILYRAIIA